MENGLLKKHEMSPEKKFIYTGNLRLEKTHFDRHKNNTAVGHRGGLPHFEKKSIFFGPALFLRAPLVIRGVLWILNVRGTFVHGKN